MIKRRYSEDTFDLEELDQHGGIEHDASLLREQLPPPVFPAFQPDQSVKCVPFVAAVTGKDKDGNDLIITKDLSRIIGKRRAVTHAVIKGFPNSFFHRIFGSTKYVIAPSVFERIPESWESRSRQPHGPTPMTFNKTILGVELGVCEQDRAEAAREAVERHTASA
jgi:hypothetical protein